MVRTSSSLLLAAVLLTGGCVAVNVGPNNPLQPVAVANKAPIIQAFDYSPKSGVGKGDAITFTLVAADQDNQPLQYNWSSTKGTLSANSGQTVSWRPTRADGSFEPGLAQVTVIVSSGPMSTTATANIQIDATGTATLKDATAPASQPVSSPAVPTTVVPSLMPSVAPSSIPSVVPSLVPSVAPSAPASSAGLHEIRLSNGVTFTTALPPHWEAGELVPDGTALVSLWNGALKEANFKVASSVGPLATLTPSDLKTILQPAGTWVDDLMISKDFSTVAGYPALKVESTIVNIDKYSYGVYYLIEAPGTLYIVDGKMTMLNSADGNTSPEDYSSLDKQLFAQDVKAIVNALKQK